MVAVAVRGIDRGQILAARRDPIDQGDCLIDREQGVDEDCVPFTENESRRYRRKHALLRARRHIVGDNR